MQELVVLPAIDLVAGQAVRLHKGMAGTETAYGDPVEIAAEFARAGATWLHLVDLDAAFGRGSNAEMVERLVRENPGLQVEACGGLRDEAAIERMLAAGAARLNLGTAALENPEWCGQMLAKYGPAIAISIDVKDGKVATRGWVEAGGDLQTVLQRLEDQGAARYVVTDVSKDGTLSGPNLELLEQVCAQTSSPVVASGGISRLEDIAALRQRTAAGIEGVIIGKALYEKRFELAQALEVARG